MVDVKVELDATEFINALDSASKEIEDLMYERVKKVGAHLKSRVVEEAPSDTGMLRASIFYRSFRNKAEMGSRIGSNAIYAPYVHQGTGIYAKNGNGRKRPWKVTTIYKRGKVTFWTVGQKPNPFITRAKDKSMGDIKKLLGVE